MLTDLSYLNEVIGKEEVVITLIIGITYRLEGKIPLPLQHMAADTIYRAFPSCYTIYSM